MKKKSNPQSVAGKNISRRDTFKYKLLLEGIIVGAVCGVLIAGFRLLLGAADTLRTEFVTYINERSEGVFIAIAVLLLIALLISCLLRFEPECSGSGIPQVEGELKGQIDMNWAKVIISKISGCVLAIGGGLALGREGPSVQLGAMVGKGFARSRKKLLTEEKLLITCGAGAGLSAAFGAPLAGAMFALEELHKTFSTLVLITTMASAAVSDWLASEIVGRDPVFSIALDRMLPLKYYWAVIILGIVLGAAGVIYNRTIDAMQNIFEYIGELVPKKLASFTKLVTVFALALLLMFVYPSALGSGAHLVDEIASGEYLLKGLLVLLAVKFIFSTASFGSGSPGGIFLPLLVLGGIIGGLFARTLSCFGISDEYIASFVVIAMAGLFSSIVRAPATGIILITEMTGSFRCLLALVVVSLLSYIIADALGGEPVYDQLWNKRMGRSREVAEELGGNRKIIIEAEVKMGSESDGQSVEALGLPEGCLIVAVIREDREIIPHGATIFRAGDHMEILCREKDIVKAERILEEKCRKFKKA